MTDKPEYKLSDLSKALQRNGFNVRIAESASEAEKIFFDEILPGMKVRTIAFGDSLTVHSTSIAEKLKNTDGLTVIEPFGPEFTPQQEFENCRQALQSDLFITGSNAVTMDGRLVNMDMVGNRIAGITFGPKKVLLFIGKNKITGSLQNAIDRVRKHVAPLNIKRLGTQNTPCMKTGICCDCNSPDRICNAMLITEKSYPKYRIGIILINEDIGI